jgi:hypothetical protein
MSLVIAKPPAEFSNTEIAAFLSLVHAGGEVATRNLEVRVKNARCLGFLRNGESLVGVAGLKQPELGYRARVEKSSGVPLSSEAFPFELGWVFILPSARGAKFSFPLCAPVVAAAGASGVFATSRSGNFGMHSTLGKLGFARVGVEWPSKQSNENLSLFIKPAA